MTEKKSYYEWCKESDIISTLKPLLTNGGYFLREIDGKLDAEKRLSWNTPWHHVKHHPDLDCNFWHKILFDMVSMKLPEKDRFVPSECQKCYKVVVKPKTVKQLFVLVELEKALGLPSKAGIEIRQTVPRLYGGYFYNIGLDQGKECYKTVRETVDAFPGLGPDVDVILKRACTEYEHELGPSDKWEITQQQIVIEKFINRYFGRDDHHRIQPDHAITYVHRTWIEWAYQNGDDTYLEFTNGKPLYEPYVTYHN